MSLLKIINRLKRQKYKLLLLILYIPVSCSLIGLLAYYMRFPSPVEGSYLFLDVFWFYANPFNMFWFYANPVNINFGYAHLFTLMLSLAFLILMIISTNTPKPIITIYPIRIILLVLIALITIIVMIFNIITPLLFRAGNYNIFLFLYVDVHLILVFLLTFLPLFRKLKTKLV